VLALNKKIIIIGGATASGKSLLAEKLAIHLDGVIINADSMQVYSDIPIISAQPSAIDLEKTPHKLYGYVASEERYSVGKWLIAVIDAIEDVLHQRKVPIVVGGTGLYLKSLTHGLANIPESNEEVRNYARDLYSRMGGQGFHKILQEKDPIIASRLSTNDRQRMLRAFEVLEQTGKSISRWQEEVNPHFNSEVFFYIETDLDRNVLYRRCDERFLVMLEEGALEEVRYLNNSLDDHYLPVMKALGVPELSDYIKERITLHEAIQKAQASIRQYAKRQLTWFRHQFNGLNKYTYHSEQDFKDLIEQIYKY
jgi:tRNA dimethylallyltransferase